MISSLLHSLESGFRALRGNVRLLFIGVLLFVFPLLFVALLQNFFTTAKQNVETAEKSSLSILHDTISVILREDEQHLLTPLFTTITTENPAITKLQVLAVTSEGFVVRTGLQQNNEGQLHSNDELLRSLPLSASEQSLIFETAINNTRVWQAFRKVETASESMIIFSEHSFAASDAVLLSRQRQAYLGLTAIFFFLLVLAYWIQRQTNWAAKHIRLAKQLSERDAFTHMIAHEFRTPLTAIKGYASFLTESRTASSDELGYANNIATSAERLVILVNDFLEVARIQSGKLQLKPQLVDIEEVLSTVCDQLRPIAQEHNLQLIYHKQQSALTLHIDKYRLVQILTNVITNSLKYTEEGHVEVEAKQHPHKLVIKVKDTGKGMTAEDQRKLFGQFTRVGDADQSNVIGSGLGMWITKQLVELLEGTIGVESIENIGTHVIITFPHK